MKSLMTEKQFREKYKLKKFADRSIDRFKLNFPIYPNKNLAKILSFLTFDGHLRWDGNVFMFTAGNKQLLKEPKILIKNEFGITGKFRKIPTNNYGTSFEYRITNKPISRILEFIGVPKGNKVLIPFSMPKWIEKNLEFSRAYLQVAFDCEGSIWKEGSERRKIRFRIHKSSKLLKNGINFLESLRKMLLKFGIRTSKIWIGEGNVRKDGEKTKYLCFNILSKDISIFNKEIGFGLEHKKKLLEGLTTTRDNSVKL